MNNLITEIRSYKITIKNQINNNSDYITYELPYCIRQLEKININSREAKQLRKSGVKIVTRKRKEKNHIIREYYKVYAIWNKGYNYRKKLVEIILNKEIATKECINCNIEYVERDNEGNIINTYIQPLKWNISNNHDFFLSQINKNIIKNSNDKLEDEYITALDIMSSYLMCDPKLTNLKQKHEPKTVSLETVLHTIDNQNSNAKKKYHEIKRMSKEQLREWKNKNKLQQQRWENSKTYRLNKIIPFQDSSYIAKWCYVDTQNIFEYNNHQYQIDSSIKEYEVDSDNQCLMDHILVVEKDNQLNFYDQNIFKINNKFIKLIS